MEIKTRELRPTSWMIVSKDSVLTPWADDGSTRFDVFNDRYESTELTLLGKHAQKAIDELDRDGFAVVTAWTPVCRRRDR